MRRYLALGIVLCAAVSSCSEDSGGEAGTGGSTADGGGRCPGTITPENDQFCDTSTATGTCAEPPVCQGGIGRPVDSCCVQIGAPGKDPNNKHLVRTTTTKEYSDPTGAPPNLGCFEASGYPPKPSDGAPKLVKLTGVIKPFANGGCDETGLTGTASDKSDAVRMEVYRVKRTGDPASDGALGDLVGAPLIVDASMQIEMEPVGNCADDERPNRRYEYPNVPMDTELLIKTYSNDGKWRALYTYNIYVAAGDSAFDEAAGSYVYDVRALASDDFNTIPTVAIGKTITAGNSVIGGEVHDCDNVRLQYARVDITAQRAELVYFNDDQDNPKPDGSRKDIGTGTTALYTALDIKVDGSSSFVRVAGTGLVPDGAGGDRLVSLGYYDVRIFPNSVTSMTLRGLRPFQLPSP
jgi:hypothetical protein